MSIECKDKSEAYTNLKTDKSNKYYYQIELANAIKYKLLDSNKVAGMLVLPTGGGKTRVAVTTALDKAMKDGYKILWIAHRHMLLEQAEQTFCEFSKLSGKDLSIKVISGKHDSIKSLDENDDIVIISNMSMGIQEKDEDGKDYDGLIRQTLKQVLFTEKQKWLVIVDEAHHSLAKSYKQWIGITTKNKNGWLRRYRKNNIKILGLTATPNFISEHDVTKYDENRTRELSSLFDDNLIGTISTQELIEKKILSLPNFITIDTEIEFDADELLSKVKNVKSSLTNSILEKELNEEIAKHEGRNRLIVATYLNGHNNIDFSKSPTLIFASNIINAITLKEAFKKENITADVIYSNKPNNDEVIENFRDGKLKILINVEILTEGSDIPEIQNVFIAKITGSKILYRQMVGRALRGLDSGGTKTANIVTFRDNIINYHKDFFNAQKLTKGLFTEIESKASSPIATTTEIDEEDIAEAYKKFAGLLNGNQNIELTSAIPIGYYDLDEVAHKVNVYQHQLDSYKNFLVAYENNNEIIENLVSDIKKQYFKSEDMLFDVTLEDLESFVNYIKNLNIVPSFVEFVFKDKLEDEVRSIALKYTSNIDFQSLEDDYNSSKYAKEFYSFIDFEEVCLNFINKYRHHINEPLKTIEVKEDEYENFTFDEKSHDKIAIFENAKNEILRVLKKTKLENSPDTFEWTPKAYRSYWGMAYAPTDDYSKKSDKIEINKILQLKGIDSKIIEFVVYHELLHTELNNYTHDKEFKEYEAMFPDFVYCEQMLYKIAMSNIENISTNIKSIVNWSFYDDTKEFTKNEIREIVTNENLTMPTMEELSELISKDSRYFRKSGSDKPRFYLSNDFNNTYSSFRVSGKYNNKKDSYMLIVKKES